MSQMHHKIYNAFPRVLVPTDNDKLPGRIYAIRTKDGINHVLKKPEAFHSIYTKVLEKTTHYQYEVLRELLPEKYHKGILTMNTGYG